MSRETTQQWDDRFMQLARQIGSWSKDRVRGVGCVIVGPHNEIRSAGFNGFPRTVDDDVDERHEEEHKYHWTEHAERNAIYNAARIGTPLANCRIYVPWFSCADCARAIIQVGITEVVGIEPDWNDSVWQKDFAITKELFDEAGISVRWFIDK